MKKLNGSTSDLMYAGPLTRCPVIFGQSLFHICCISQKK